VLKIAAKRPHRTAHTDEIKEEIPEYYPLADIDKEPFPSRGLEPRWRQITGNVVSHGQTANGIFGRGLAEKIPKGLRVTTQGVAYLKSLGFSVA
jgi:hypothetical protein